MKQQKFHGRKENRSFIEEHTNRSFMEGKSRSFIEHTTEVL
jgi:hypothetical protein